MEACYSESRVHKQFQCRRGAVRFLMSILVIGYGNELRGDDGIGPKLADVIAELHLDDVQVIRTHQLTPELADPISAADAVVFIDASIDEPRQVVLRPITARNASRVLAHRSAPSDLLALAQAVFGKSPRAWMLTLPAFDFNLSEHLSSPAEKGMSAGLHTFRGLWSELTNSSQRMLHARTY